MLAHTRTNWMKRPERREATDEQAAQNEYLRGCILVAIHNGMTLKRIAELAEVSENTVSRYYAMETRFPQWHKVRAVVIACGGQMNIVPPSSTRIRMH